ncbi:MAG: hypothetical protein KDC24_08365 [Saprospiraceae bacterium]|nr:hypothetical protein [Saprospiraceae bacterium]
MKPFYVVIIALLLSGQLLARQQDTQAVSTPSIFDYFQQDEVLEVAIFADFSKLLDEKLTSEDYQDATIRIMQPKGQISSIPVKLKPRGRFRRKVCDFPPLKLKFKKDFLLQNGLDTFNKLKLVTHCLADPTQNTESILKEYLAYKMLNMLTDQSFRVQLLYINYVDITGKLSNVSAFGFILEEDEQVAHRMGGTLTEQFSTPESDLDRKQAGTVAMFQYMIGNPDWDITMCRNLKMVKRPGGDKLCIIPYDFDFSGWVKPDYLKDHDKLKKRGEERVLKGINLSQEEITDISENFISKRTLFSDTITNAVYLDKMSRNKLLKYLDNFYSELEDLNTVQGK